MFKIINKKKYNKMNKELRDRQRETDTLKGVLTGLDLEKNNAKDLNKNYEDRIKRLEAANTNLINTNEQLVDWVKTILEQVGTCDVTEKTPFTIPIYKDRGMTRFFGNMSPDQDLKSMQYVKNIIIPEIRIVEMGSENNE